jgi:hypothetical protein
VTASRNPIATEHMPFFITAPGDSDVLFNISVVFTVAMFVLTGVIWLTIQSLPDRIANKSQKVQLDVVALLCLLSILFRENIFWVAALILAFLDIPDLLTPVKRIAASVATVARRGKKPPEDPSTDHSEPLPPEVAIADVPRQDQKGDIRLRHSGPGAAAFPK